MATVYHIYRSRIDYDYDQSKMAEQNMRDLEEAEEAGVTPPPERWLFEEIDAIIDEVSHKYDFVEVNNWQGGPCWNAYLILTGEVRKDVKACARELEKRLGELPFTKIKEG